MKFFLSLALTAAVTGSLFTSANAAATPTPGGSNQINAVAGCANQWLFNGVWRFKVDSLSVGDYYGHPEWTVLVELRNGTSKTHQFQDTGMYYTGRGVQLVDADDNASDVVGDDFYYHFSNKPLIQGQGIKYKMLFRDLGQGKPAKLIMPIDPSKSANTDAVHYAVKDPSFRVNLTCGLPAAT